MAEAKKRLLTYAGLRALEEEGILGGYPLDEHHILWCCTEVNTKEEMDQVIQILKEVPAC